MLDTSQITVSEEEELQRIIKNMMHKKRELEIIHDQLWEQLHAINKSLVTLGTERAEHNERFLTILAQQLEKNDKPLAEEQQKALRYNISTPETVTNIKKKLVDQYKLKIPKDASDFYIVTCEAIVSSLSSSLQNIDKTPTILKDTLKNLDVIDEEKKASEKLREKIKIQFNVARALVAELLKKANEVDIFPLADSERYQKIKVHIDALEKKAAEALLATTPEDSQTLEDTG